MNLPVENMIFKFPHKITRPQLQARSISQECLSDTIGGPGLGLILSTGVYPSGHHLDGWVPVEDKGAWVRKSSQKASKYFDLIPVA